MEPNLTQNGFYYFKQGCYLITLPGIKRFVILPLLANIVIIGGLFYILLHQYGNLISFVLSYVPSWLQWLDYLMWPVLVVLTLLFFGYFFSMLANLIASPFNSLLAEQIEVKLTGKSLSSSSLTQLITDIPRIVGREITKLGYSLPRLFFLFMCSFIPVIGQTIIPIISFLFNSWMMSLQYGDYAFDNYKISFRSMRFQLKNDRHTNIQFGMLIYLLTLIPFINLFIMPIAVCGATKMWVDRYRDHNL